MSVSGPDEQFLGALLGDDELGLVIRAHIHIESGINELLDVAVPHPKQLPHLRYEQKLKLACALGLQERLFKPLNILGHIRNAFGHNLNTSISEVNVNDLYGALAEQDRKGFLLGIEANLVRLRIQNVDQFPTLSPRVRFIFLAIGLDKAMAQARSEFLEGRNEN